MFINLAAWLSVLMFVFISTTVNLQTIRLEPNRKLPKCRILSRCLFKEYVPLGQKTETKGSLNFTHPSPSSLVQMELEKRYDFLIFKIALAIVLKTYRMCDESL